jgi:hypothetical protein
MQLKVTNEHRGLPWCWRVEVVLTRNKAFVITVLLSVKNETEM